MKHILTKFKQLEVQIDRGKGNRFFDVRVVQLDSEKACYGPQLVGPHVGKWETCQRLITQQLRKYTSSITFVFTPEMLAALPSAVREKGAFTIEC